MRFTVSSLARDWFFGRCRGFLNKPDEGLGGATDLADPALIALIPGADRLPTEGETGAPDDDEGRQASSAEGDGDGTDGTDTTDGTDGTDDDAGNGEGEGEGEGEETPEKKMEELTAKNAELEKQVEELKAQSPAPVLAPTRSNPLANVSDERGLAANETFAKRLKTWAFRASKDGGEMPAEIQAALEGKKAEEISEPRVLTAEEAADLYEQAEAMLTEHVPARREYLQHQTEANAFLQENYPDLLKPTTEAGKVYAAFQQQFPEIKLLGRWPTVLAATVLGHLQMQREFEAKKGNKGGNGKPAAQKKTVTTTNGKTVPLAPGAGNGGARKPVTPQAEQKRAVEAGQKVLSGKASEDDLLAVFSVAE